MVEATFLQANQPIGVTESGEEVKSNAYFEDLLYNYLARMGGEGNDLIAGSYTTSLDSDKFMYFAALVKKIARQVNELDIHDSSYFNSLLKDVDVRTSGFNTKIKTSSYTAINKDYIEARNNAPITMPLNPQRNDEIMIANGDGTTIKVLGNGNKFKYTTKADVFNIYNTASSKHFQWFSDNDLNESYWRVR